MQLRCPSGGGCGAARAAAWGTLGNAAGWPGLPLRRRSRAAARAARHQPSPRSTTPHTRAREHMARGVGRVERVQRRAEGSARRSPCDDALATDGLAHASGFGSRDSGIADREQCQTHPTVRNHSPKMGPRLCQDVETKPEGSWCTERRAGRAARVWSGRRRLSDIAPTRPLVSRDQTDDTGASPGRLSA